MDQPNRLRRKQPVTRAPYFACEASLPLAWRLSQLEFHIENELAEAEKTRVKATDQRDMDRLRPNMAMGQNANRTSEHPNPTTKYTKMGTIGFDPQTYPLSEGSEVAAPQGHMKIISH